MKYAYLIFAITICLSCKTVTQDITAVKNSAGDLIGFADKNSFNQAPYNTWFTQRLNNYKPDSTTITRLKKHLKGVTIKGFMGTWCGDSKRETPHFYNILEQANFNFKKLTLVTVNRSKKTPDNLQEGYNIIRVPTFIFYKNGKEIGRYVEYARETLEKDILKIVSNQPYKHAYDKSK